MGNSAQQQDWRQAMTSWIRAILIGIVVGLAFAVAAITVAPYVHADESSYINQVDANGTEVTSATLTLGHQVCAEISHNGVDGLDMLAIQSRRAGMKPRDTAVIIAAAVSELCPSNLPAVKAWLSEPTGQA